MRALLLLILLSACTATPQADHRAGRHAEAAARFAARRDTSALAAYNLATARLALGEHDAARGALESAARRAAEPALRFAAHFNAGLADLAPAAGAPPGDSAAAVRLRRAVQQYRAALRLHPGDADAKWNLELTERLLAARPERPPPPPDPQPSAGGGGGGADSPPDPGNPELTREEAERILAAADREERAVQRARLRAAPSSERPARDW